jgi:hypothetical protein
MIQLPSLALARRPAPAAKPLVRPVKVRIYGFNRDIVDWGPNSELILRLPSTVVGAILAATGQEVSVTL